MDISPLDEVLKFGQPFHGPSYSGQVHLPNGAMVANVGTDEPEVYVCRFDDQPVPETTAEEVAAGLLWRNYAVFHGKNRRYAPGSTAALGQAAWLYRTTDGAVYLLQLLDSTGSVTVQAKRFGEIGEDVTTESWSTIATFNWTIAEFAPGVAWGNPRPVMLAVLPNGSQAIANLYRMPYNDDLLVNVLDVSVSGGSASAMPSVTIQERTLSAGFCHARPNIWLGQFEAIFTAVPPDTPNVLLWKETGEVNEWVRWENVAGGGKGQMFEYLTPLGVTYSSTWSPIEIGFYRKERFTFSDPVFPLMPAGGSHPGVSYTTTSEKRVEMRIGGSTHALYSSTTVENNHYAVSLAGSLDDGSGTSVYHLGVSTQNSISTTGDAYSGGYTFAGRFCGQTSGVCRLTAALSNGDPDITRSYAWSVADNWQSVTYSYALTNTASYQPITGDFTTTGGFF